MFASSRDISTFPFSVTQKNKLLKAGFKIAADLNDISPTELAKGTVTN